ncbi:MAG: NTP transferase domain-containing protein [Rhodospirillales bacterium]
MTRTPKVLIIAAGQGSRMLPITEDKPKCMADFAGKTLLRRQLDAYADAGLSDVAVIRGYKKERIDYDGITYFENTDYLNNNILCSMFAAADYIEGEIVVAYSDILFESSIVKRLLQSTADISILVDTDWRGYYVGRVDHPLEEAENVVVGEAGQVERIGKHLTDDDGINGEFIGMMKLTAKGARIFKDRFFAAKAEYWDKPFQNAKKFQVAYITDMVQELVDHGIAVNCVTIERGWKEIDTVEDYRKAVAALEKEQVEGTPSDGK